MHFLNALYRHHHCNNSLVDIGPDFDKVWFFSAQKLLWVGEIEDEYLEQGLSPWVQVQAQEPLIIISQILKKLTG